MKYLGVLLCLIGACLLIATGFVPSLSNNAMLGCGFLLVLGGFITHIFMGRATIK